MKQEQSAPAYARCHPAALKFPLRHGRAIPVLALHAQSIPNWKVNRVKPECAVGFITPRRRMWFGACGPRCGCALTFVFCLVSVLGTGGCEFDQSWMRYWLLVTSAGFPEPKRYYSGWRCVG
jgi:hypothetical protein